ncbi:MAG TPA: hypothetical protein VIH86_05875 [Puia sp.]|jgi:biopolymer transport protein ExbD
MLKTKLFYVVHALTFFFSIAAYSQQIDTTIKYYKTTLVPIETTNPSMTTRKIDESAYFTIHMTIDSFNVTHKKQILPIHTISQLDKYINEHIQSIRKHSIILEGPTTLPYEKFNEVLGVLKKYDFHRFSLVTIPPK